MSDYVKGTPAKIWGEFRLMSDNSYFDPDVVTFSFYLAPDGTATTYTYGTDVQLVRYSAGKYYVVLPNSGVGIYKSRFVGTGLGASADERQTGSVSFY